MGAEFGEEFGGGVVGWWGRPDNGSAGPVTANRADASESVKGAGPSECCRTAIADVQSAAPRL